MKLDDIGFYTLSDARARNASISTPLWRCELILTDRCNFNCPYCMKIREDYNKDLTYPEAERIVGLWCDGGMKNLRLSGGEPTLWPRLVDLVQYANHRGTERIAISTNGSAHISRYLELVGAGVNDFSISLDACCASTADTMSGRSGVYDRIVNNIKELSKLTYVTVGVVLTESNITELPEIIKIASGMGVADIRVITAAQWNYKLSDFNINSHILDKHPILKYRINNYTSGRNVRGLADTDSHKCPLVLDDMAVAANYHFPCIIYMRQRGDPIGEMHGSIEHIREKRRDWYWKTNTHQDSICKRICLDVCVDYNNKFRDANYVFDYPAAQNILAWT